ncbi:hypothetical protein AD01_2257 [Escherichia coli 2-427-07_S4_C2]|uniref:Uncharacterized protein n=1 Tax=Escherichia coli O25b:H4 TaxID=941280 RepID=A0A192CE73_ECO25|nr:hypothetical protein WLH_02740 [Escherichia coli O25b:H4]AWZ80605.1 hypothetical protein CSC38_3546 [Escherichia coli]EFR14921.1 hypothetical protein EC236275_4021 [Escherichia coli 2362-75]EFU55368.1 hypothetical protein HMPREF9545_04911 [Escherichia coli MS 16-3]EGB78493.1 hypothetical protein HMPREF9532_00982 [Escherichia coli MS 57-2]EHU04942.1 hypothetical protein ECDEC1A_3903 [Escherichia coli DEC1A]EHU05058.1 hypothetical protein ECDEC1C_4207 [Escherichia coli DEC1C]EHU21331.1 hypo
MLTFSFAILLLPFFALKYYQMEIKEKSKVIISGRYDALYLLYVEENPFLF